MGAGGAIFYEKNVQSNISNCNFTFNNAESCGAFVANYDIETSISNSNFIANEAKTYAGVGYGWKMKSLKINNSTFKENQAQYATVLLLNDSLTLNIAHSKFGNNVATRTSTSHNNKGSKYPEFQNLVEPYIVGQALILSNIINATLDDSEFINSNAGAIFIDREVKLFIITCAFTNNSALSGGAVSILSDSVVKVINSSFIGNSAIMFGGAFKCSNSTLSLVNSSFINNTARTGGAVVVNETGAIIDGCRFNANMAEIGGAMGFFNSTMDLQHNLFIKNELLKIENELIEIVIGKSTLTLQGGALYFKYASGYLFNNSFNENIAEEGYALYLSESSVEINHCDFVSNGETKNRSISLDLSELENATLATVFASSCFSPLVITNSRFKYNTGGTIGTLNCSLIISNSTFMGIKGIFGGAVFAVESYTIYIKNSSFQKNTATHGGGSIAIVSRYSRSNRIHIESSNFTKNQALFGGSVIFGNATVDICCCSFLSNSAAFGGGVFGIHAALNVNNCSFVKNNGTPYSVPELIIWRLEAVWRNIFKGKYYHRLEEETLLIKYFSLLWKHKVIGRSVIYEVFESLKSWTYYTQNGFPMEAPTEELKDPFLSEGAGASLFLLRSKLYVSDCNFRNNTSVHTGGIFTSEAAIYIDNGWFDGNTGGALMAVDSSVHIVHSNFAENQGNNTGANWIRHGSSLFIHNSCFHSNEALDHGTVKISDNSTCDMVNCFCYNNSAHFGGVLQVRNNGQLSINDTTFHTNRAALGGAIFGSAETTVKLNNSTFVNNSALEGGAFHLQSHSAVYAEHCFIEKNKEELSEF